MALSKDGTAISWFEYGSGEPLLLIAGQAMSHRGWLSVLPHFTDRFRCILLDHRGIGESELGATKPLSTSVFAEDCIAVLQAAGVEQAHIYGFSMGGRIAQRVAIEHPEAVNKLVLCATTAGNTRGTERSAEATADLYSGNWRRLAPHFFSAEFLEENDDLSKDFFRTNAERATLQQHFAASKEHDSWDELPSITVPTLVIHGGADNLTPIDHAENLAARIPGASLEVVPNALHGFFVELPEVSHKVREFLLS